MGRKIIFIGKCISGEKADYLYSGRIVQMMMVLELMPFTLLELSLQSQALFLVKATT